MTASVEPAAPELRLVFAGGGTGGHLYPAIAIAEAFRQRVSSVRTLFIGTERGLEARVLPGLGYRLELVSVRGLLRKLTWSNLMVPVDLIRSVRQCRRLLREFQPHLVIGTGGYVSGPALLAARLSGRRFVIQEQNSFPGLANRVFGNHADAVFLSFEESRKYFRKQHHVHVVGNPVRSNLQARTPEMRQQAAQKWRLHADKTTLFVFGGSQGARRINEAMVELLPRLAQLPGLQVLWVTGPSHFERIAALTQQQAVRAVPYIDDMNLAYALADFVLCRAGATTIFELMLCGLPSILIPFPFATADHQTFNARALEYAGAAIVVLEKDLRAEVLFDMINTLARDTHARRKMAKAAHKHARPNAAAEIVEVCMNLIEQKN